MPEASKREPKVEDGSEDEEDLDDLDDVLETLDRPKPVPAAKTAPPGPSAPSTSAKPAAGPSSSSAPAISAPPAAPLDEDDEDAAFEAELAREMEALLRGSGAGPASAGAGGGPSGMDALRSLGLGGPGGEDAELDPEQRAAAEELQRMFAQMMDGSGEGMGGERIPSAGAGAGRTSGKGAGTDKPLSFDETIAATMNNLKSSASRAREASATPGPSMAGGDPFAALLSQLSSLDPSSIDPSLLDALKAGTGDEDGQGDIGKMLDGMMSQLMSREVLEEPLSELAEKYQPYIDTHGDLPAETLNNYRTQLSHIHAILALFRDPRYTDEPPAGPAGAEQRKLKEEVGRLMGIMQELGSPPEEVMGEMPEGFDLGDLGGGEQCSIM